MQGGPGIREEAAFRRLRLKSDRPEELSLLWDREDPDSGLCSQSIEAADLLEAFFSRLTAEERVLVRRLLEGEPISKIVNELHISERTLERRMESLRAKFEAFLDEQTR